MTNISKSDIFSNLQFLKNLIFDFRYIFDLVTGMVFLLLGIIVVDAKISSLESVLSIIIMSAAGFLAHLVNHIEDFKGDIINKKELGNELNLGFLNIIVYITLAVILLLIISLYFENKYIAFFWLYILISNFAYTYIFMKKGWAGIISISVLYISYLFFGIFAGGTRNIPNLLIYSISSLLILLGTTPLKDMGDIEGDKSTGKITPAIIHGNSIFKILAVILTVAAITGFYGFYLFRDFWYMYSAIIFFSLIPAILLYFNRKEMWGIAFKMRMYFISLVQLWIIFLLLT